MANYVGFTRSNYFSVTDEEKFRQLIADSYCDGDNIEIFERNIKGSVKFAFGCYGSIYGVRTLPDDDSDADNYDVFVEALQSILAGGDAIIINEVGCEDLRYIIGHSSIITKSDAQFISLWERAVAKARIMLGNPGYSTKMDF